MIFETGSPKYYWLNNVVGKSCSAFNRSNLFLTLFYHSNWGSDIGPSIYR